MMSNGEGLTELHFIIKEFIFTGWMMNKDEGLTEIQFIIKEFKFTGG